MKHISAFWLNFMNKITRFFTVNFSFFLTFIFKNIYLTSKHSRNRNLSVNSSLAPFKTASYVPVKSEPGAWVIVMLIFEHLSVNKFI